MRVCPICHTAKTVTEFSHPRLPCRPCQAERVRQWYTQHRQVVIAAVRERENPERRRAVHRANMRVATAIRQGVLTRPQTCEQCGAARVIEAAHFDYTHPLEVRWLCRPCHRQWDREEPKF